MLKITEKKLLNILENIKGTTAVSIVSITIPKYLKQSRTKREPFPFKILPKKISVVSGMIGFNYQNSVNNQRLREEKQDDFVAEPRKWGERVPKTPFVTYKDEYYLEIKVQSSESVYLLRNKPIAKELLEDFLPKSSSSRQELDKEVILRDYKISNIYTIKLMNEVYIIKQLPNYNL